MDSDEGEDYLSDSDDVMYEQNENRGNSTPERRYPPRDRRPIQRYGQNIYT